MNRIQQLREDLSEDLNRIARRFKKNPKLTLVVRNPDLADGDVVLSNDDPELAIAAIRGLFARPETEVK